MFMPHTLPVVLTAALALAAPALCDRFADAKGAIVRAAVSPVSATTVPFGPPWVSIEYPVNPYDQTTRSAFLLVHSFHHGTAVDFPVTGTAEGLVKGERRSLPLQVAKTSRVGVYAVSKQWPNDGVWTLIVSVAQGPDDKVFAVVELAPSGEVASVRVPTRRLDGGTIALPAPVSMTDVESSLRSRAALLAATR